MGKFDSIQIGDKAEVKHVITNEDVDKFVELTGDDNKLHVDEDYVSKTTYKKPVVHGMLGSSFISTVIGTRLPGDGALWFAQNLEFLLPVRIGDEITVKAEVIKKTDSLKIVELRTDIFNQHKQKITAGVAKVKIVEQEAIQELPDLENKEKNRPQKYALVVGGTGGIGEATCLHLAKEGFNVAIHYCNNKKKALEIKKKIEEIGRKSVVFQADITDKEEVEEIVRKVLRSFNTITALVNCATIRVPNIKYDFLDWDDFQKHIDVNIKGSFNLIKNVLPVMKLGKYGKIILITSQYIETPTIELLPYITAKSALSGFSKALAIELAPSGISVNVVSPGMTKTELIVDIPEKMKLLTAARTPLGRIATPDDVASAISFLASEKSDFITGETIRVNGGQVML